jgi:hypothetical protein
MTRTSEPITVTSEAVLDVALTLSADRSNHGTALSQTARGAQTAHPELPQSRSPSTASC